MTVAYVQGKVLHLTYKYSSLAFTNTTTKPTRKGIKLQTHTHIHSHAALGKIKQTNLCCVTRTQTHTHTSTYKTLPNQKSVKWKWKIWAKIEWPKTSTQKNGIFFYCYWMDEVWGQGKIAIFQTDRGKTKTFWQAQRTEKTKVKSKQLCMIRNGQKWKKSHNLWLQVRSVDCHHCTGRTSFANFLQTITRKVTESRKKKNTE